MNIEKDLEFFILYDKKNILKQIEILKVKLRIKDAFKIYFDDIDTIFLKHLNLEDKLSNVKKQMELNKNKNLELYCKKNGKQIYIKSFGKINDISKKKLNTIFKLLMLIKLNKKINEISYLSSQVFRADKLI